MKRIVWNSLSSLALLLFACSAAVWIRSLLVSERWVWSDGVQYSSYGVYPTGVAWQVELGRGKMGLTKDTSWLH